MSKPVVFISYSHKDEEEKDALVKHLKVLNAKFALWCDDEMAGGDDWEEKIEKSMAQATLAILLISANFLTSDFIGAVEIPTFLERRKNDGMHVFPIIAKHCAWKKVKWLQQLNVRPKNGNPIWRDGGKFADEELAKITEEISRLAGKKEETVISNDSGWATPKNYKEEVGETKERDVFHLRLPFTNREDELKQITSSFAPAYHLVDAPAGYGKTVLLQEIQHRFDEQNWITAYVSVQENRAISDIARELAIRLNVIISTCGDAKQWGLKLGKAIVKKYEKEVAKNNNNKKSGVVLFIDVDKRGWASLLPTINSLIKDFIPGLEYNLRGSQHFTSQQNAFRVILAGRYLAGKIPTESLELSVSKLEPFRHRVIRDTVRKYLPHENNTKQLAANLMYYTAGHPGCIARVLKRYNEKGYPPDEFFEYEKEIIWEEIVWPEADAVYNDIRRGLRRIFSDLSVFRYLDYAILQKLLDESVFSGYDDPYNLADELTRTYLLNWEGRLLQDSITRRLLALRLWREIGEKSFAGHCQRAYSICLEKLLNPKTQLLEKWAIEGLFQALQKHAEIVQGNQKQHISKRENLHKEFFDEVVPSILEPLFAGRDSKTELNALLLAMESDWEFRFMINYSLRKNQFTNEPYLKLKQDVELYP